MAVSQLGSKNKSRTRRITLLALTAFTTTLVLAGCSSGKAPDTSSTQASSSGSASAAQPGSTDGAPISIIMIGGADGDPFFAKIKRGVDDASRAYGSDLKVTFVGPKDYNNLGPDVAKLEQTALSQSPTVIVSPDWVPDSQNDAFKAISSKIPLFLYNSGGASAAKDVGALGYIGTEEEIAGKAAGETFAKDGAKHVLCVNTVPGAANTEARCKGAQEGAGSGVKVEELSLPATTFGSPTAITQAVKAQLLKDSSIDAVLSIGAADSDSAYAAVKSANAAGKVKLGCFDTSTNVAARIKAGDQLFAIDQQPYLQGFLTVTAAYQYAKWGLLVSSNPLLTGPLVLNKDNVQAAIDGATTGTR